MISIISPVYNEEKFIRKAVLSVLRQSYKNLELIVVDDQSNDDTLSILKEIEKKDSRLHVISNPQKGKVNAVNLAYQESRGEWIMLMAGDDIMGTDILAKWMHYAEDYDPYNTAIAFASKVREFSDDEQYKRFNNLILPKKNVATIMGSNYLMSRKIADTMFPLPTSYPNEDGWTRLCFRYLDFNTVFVNAIAMNYRRHSNNSVNPNAHFADFNESYHSRKIVAKEFLNTYKDLLSSKQKESLNAEITIEEQRFNGDWFGVLFSNRSPLSEKIRNLMLSRDFLYKIKLRSEKYLLGLSMR